MMATVNAALLLLTGTAGLLLALLGLGWLALLEADRRRRVSKR